VIAHKENIPGYYSNVWVEPKKPKDLKLITSIESFRDSVAFNVVHTRSVEKMIFEMYRHDYDYIFLDHLHDLPGARNADSSISIDPLFHAIDSWKAGSGGLVFIALQARKISSGVEGMKRDLSIHDVYGSQAIISNITSLLGIQSNIEHKTARVVNLKSRWGGEGGSSTSYKFNNGVFTEK